MHQITEIPTETEELVILKFSAPWCGPCRRIAPEIEKLANLYPDIHFYEVDIDEATELADHFEVKAVPTFIALRVGKELQRVSGTDLTKIKTLLLN